MTDCTTTGVTTREVFQINRELEFFSRDELVKQIGFAPRLWPSVIVGELVDNSLDACEEAGILPDIQIYVNSTGITVADNGPGIPAEVVEKMIDFQHRVSSRVGSACPTRGAQGNAAKCLIALPFTIDGDRGKVTIRSRGKLHSIETTMNHISQSPRIKLTSTDSQKVQIGTSVSIGLACSAEDHSYRAVVLIVEKYAVLNPHLRISLNLFGKTHLWDRTSHEIKKWTAAESDPAAWHDAASFRNLLANCVRSDEATGRARTVREFLQTFAGMKRSAVLKSVLDRAAMHRLPLAEIEEPEWLLELVQDETTPPAPLKLGCVGKDHLKQFLPKCEYKRITGYTESGLPFVIEAAFAENSPGPLRVWSGINFSADVSDPAHGELMEWLAELRVTKSSSAVLFFHITSPRVEFTDRGKTNIDTCQLLDDAAFQAIKSVTRKYTVKMLAMEREASRPSRSQSDQSTTIRDAIFAVMEESIAVVSQGGTCDFSARNHYYAVRPLIQREGLCPGSSLTQSYLDKIVDEWELQHGIIQRRTRDPRGFLLEPHTGKQIPLGTTHVNNYSIPWHLYHTVIYVEKKGLLSNFQFGKIAEKYDAAIICAEGFAVRAAQSLMQAAAEGHKMQVFVFHDADPSGYGIARAIGEQSGAHRFDFEVIDAGLQLDDALAMGLETERFTRSKALPSGIPFTEAERKLFTGHAREYTGKNGKPKTQWLECQRVELNALAALPAQFVAWVESVLDEHGAARKLIPSPQTVLATAERQYREQRLDAIRAELLEQLGIEATANALNQSMAATSFAHVVDELADWSLDCPPESWQSFIGRAVAESIENEPIAKAVESAIRTKRK